MQAHPPPLPPLAVPNVPVAALNVCLASSAPTAIAVGRLMSRGHARMPLHVLIHHVAPLALAPKGA
jgi:hypothetical protein